MKKYSAEDIKRIDWDEHVRVRPAMYFPSENITPIDLFEAIEHSARVLGASEINTKRIGCWYVFWANVDWVFSSEFKIESVKEVFSRPHYFPEDGRSNSFRTECLVKPFCSSVFTSAGAESTLVKGEYPPKNVLEFCIEKFSNKGRFVCFCLEHTYNKALKVDAKSSG